MPVYKNKSATKDGRQWQFRTYYTLIDGNKKQFKSIKYKTKEEAILEESKFLLSRDNFKEIRADEMTIGELREKFMNYKKDKVKETTFRNYIDKSRRFTEIDKIKVADFDIKHFEKWRKYLNSCNICTNYKNDIFKFLKSIMNYGTKIHDLDFTKIYVKMEKFINRGEIKKEMLYFTFEEFNKYISVVDDNENKTFFKTLYYCGTRKGEAKALTWNDINFEKEEISINKTLSDNVGGKRILITSPKTDSSYRNLPIHKTLLEDLKELYNAQKEKGNFRKDMYVFGGEEPYRNSYITYRKNKYCKLAGVK